jgi:hypothetical protein
LILKTDKRQYMHTFRIKGKKLQYIFNILTIFMFLMIFVTGSAASSYNVHGQSNETQSQTENIIEGIPESSLNDNNEKTNEQVISESGGSTGNDSSSINSQIGDDESNVANESPDSKADGDCLFDPSLPKCAPDEKGNCPEDFHMNEDEQCFPTHDRCATGYQSHEYDASGKCIPDSVPCDPGYIMNPDFPICEYKDYVCKKHHDLKECKVEDDDTANNLPYKSGYNHGCSDVKISDSTKRYTNQPGKGPAYHKFEFMRGYNDGFESCINNSSSSPTTQGIFRVIVQVTNQSPHDMSGGITISVDHQPENIFRSAYGIYFPAGETISTTFTLKSSDVPLGTMFEVNVDYGDDYNQYTFGENSPVKRPEIVQFVIP